MKKNCRSHKTLFFILQVTLSFALIVSWPVTAQEHAYDHDHHAMTDEQFAELREKVPLYREMTNEQIIDNMQGMGAGLEMYVSGEEIVDKIGVLALGHGFGPDGNELFRSAYVSTAAKHPTSLALGMAMMSSDFIQAAVDDLTAAGAETILVVPVTTLKSGKLHGQWSYIFGGQDDAPWLSVPRVESDARIVFGPTPSDGPIISEILLDYAKQASREPENEAVALISHGATNAEANAHELTVLEQHANAIRSGSSFAAVQGFTLQDDAPSAIRSANVERMRAWIGSAAREGRRVIVLTTLPVRTNVHEKLRVDLAELDFEMNEKGITEHPLFSEWIESVIASAK